MPHAFTQADRTKFARALPPGASILDVGCGPGNDTGDFTGRGFKVVGADLARDMLAIARTRAPQGRFVQMDMRHLGFRSGAFDAVWASFSFLHVHERWASTTLEGFRRVLKPEGWLFLSAHTAEATGFHQRVISGLTGPEGEQLMADVQEWRQDDLLGVLLVASFEIHTFRAYTREGGLYPLLSVLAKAAD